MAVKTASARRKEAMAASYLRGQKRKEARNEANAKLAAKNRELRANGEPTPWEAAKAARKDSVARKAKRLKWEKDNRGNQSASDGGSSAD